MGADRRLSARLVFFCGLVALTALLTAAAGAQAGPRVVIDGRPLVTAEPPRVSGDRIMVPMREIFTALGAEVAWDEKTRTITAVRGETTLKLRPGEKVAYKDGRAVGLDAAPLVAGGRVLVPLRFIGEALGLEVTWDEGARTAYLASKADGLPFVGSLENLRKLLGEAQHYTVRAASVAAEGAALGTGAVPQTATRAPAGVSADHSTTNVQVAGVDEADVVKTDGRYIYQVNGGRVLIIDAYPPEKMRVAGVIELSTRDFAPREIYVDEKYLVVIGTAGPGVRVFRGGGPAEVRAEIYPPPPIRRRYVRAVVYDVTDKAAAQKVREVELEGEYVSSRKIGSALYLVVNKGLDYYYIMEQGGKEGILPAYRDGNGGGDYKEIPLSAVRYFPHPPEPAYLLVAGLDLDRPEKEMQVAAYLGAGQDVYASRENLYVAVTRYEADAEESPRLAPDCPTKTAVYKFALEGGRVRYLGRGEVPGTVLNQFSMDEYQGYFRLATTVGDVWRTDERTSKNNVYILDAGLKVVGRLENLAPGERIYAVRFLGPRAYVVTFRTVDPLFVLDLAAPRKPQVLGALKIPGYSDYLHPYDENHLLGFGKETIELSPKDAQGREAGTVAFYQGMKMALFDVSDVRHPVEKFREVIGDRGTDSELLRNHKALLFSREKNLLAFPVTVMEIAGEGAVDANGFPRYGEFSFQGAYVYSVDLEQGFRLQARITHLTEEDYARAGGRWYDADRNVERILYIGETLYTLSRDLVKAHDLKTFREVNSLLLP